MLQNSVTIIGNLGQDLDLKNIQNRNVVNFSLATNENYKNSAGEKVEKTVWHKCVAWGKIAEILVKYTHKGDKIGIKGKLTYGKYEKEIGEEKIEIQTVEILIEDFIFLGTRKKE
ncbi:single-stranded DNA-binding protein [Tenacibaculum finnmarkense]|uniref:single-stranded DNA-binding protein n=1 Tax=Tenacibaculum finnmarkense TaxID=2781243 RepID=UPI001EFA2D80|nr:single-stranded DNA-binding protein [Tenacibaculum finnmarkense]MCG8226365.1 single-stranded DNA-binding protein [Tenacibaculum finnmarkense genomovar finnmarkense]